jgi:hypothetical protein
LRGSWERILHSPKQVLESEIKNCSKVNFVRNDNYNHQSQLQPAHVPVAAADVPAAADVAEVIEDPIEVIEIDTGGVQNDTPKRYLVLIK